tara:strand:+ start:56 stop:592 length:537 start_codon:yes stop_codon:yes gene_type:complete
MSGLTNSTGAVSGLIGTTEAPLAAGKALQVVQTTYTSPESHVCNDADADTSFTCAITPSSTSSKVMIFGNAQVGCYQNFTGFGLGIKRDSTVIGTPTSGGDNAQSRYHTGWGNPSMFGAASCPMVAPFNFLDSPASTSSITYKIFFRGVPGVTTLYLNRTSNDNSEFTSVMTLVEIAA